MSLSDKAVSGIKYGPIDHGHVIQMLENISKYIDSLDLEGAKSAIHSYISDLTQGENKGFEEPDDDYYDAEKSDDYKESKVSDHFGEQQAEGLDNLLAGLKDGPKDERW